MNYWGWVGGNLRVMTASTPTGSAHLSSLLTAEWQIHTIRLKQVKPTLPVSAEQLGLVGHPCHSDFSYTPGRPSVHKNTGKELNTVHGNTSSLLILGLVHVFQKHETVSIF
jgi:hypothetical protein